MLLRNLVAWCMISWSVLGFSAEKLSMTVDASAPQFTISLPANPTTGFKWVVKHYDTTHFTFLKAEYVATVPTRIGSGGQTKFVFSRIRGVKYPKNSRMTFSYSRPWDAKSGSETIVTIKFIKPVQTK